MGDHSINSIDDHRCVFCFTDLYSNWYFGPRVWHIHSHGAEPAKDASYHFSSAHGEVGNWVPMGGANPVLHFMAISWLIKSMGMVKSEKWIEMAIAKTDQSVHSSVESRPNTVS